MAVGTEVTLGNLTVKDFNDNSLQGTKYVIMELQLN